ncbi:hypothetical protein PAPYR_5759 [Paratrimastix pyriformis]|uniref:HECT domain-containing protein n=1 Tax=Paratrimastix pyriformis TaxID=342808 RepID=A0ABQ8UIC6_9EUKA|nr:hypothetical protein PAPYR_5759 [Paratrimastix pyriformis]
MGFNLSKIADLNPQEQIEFLRDNDAKIRSYLYKYHSYPLVKDILPLHYFAGRTDPYSIGLVEFLLQQPELNPRALSSSGRTALHDASLASNLGAATKLIESCPPLMFIPDTNGAIPFQYSILFSLGNTFPLLGYMLTKHARRQDLLETRDAVGRNAFHLAFLPYRISTDLAEQLVEALRPGPPLPGGTEPLPREAMKVLETILTQRDRTPYQNTPLHVLCSCPLPMSGYAQGRDWWIPFMPTGTWANSNPVSAASPSAAPPGPAESAEERRIRKTPKRILSYLRHLGVPLDPLNGREETPFFTCATQQLALRKGSGPPGRHPTPGTIRRATAPSPHGSNASPELATAATAAAAAAQKMAVTENPIAIGGAAAGATRGPLGQEAVPEAAALPVDPALPGHPGVNINHTDTNGDSLLHLAVRANDAVMLNFLLSFPGIDVALTNKAGYAPLHVAIIENRLLCLRILVQREHIPPSPDRQGRSPLHLAAQGTVAGAAALILRFKPDWAMIPLSPTDPATTALHLLLFPNPEPAPPPSPSPSPSPAPALSSSPSKLGEKRPLPTPPPAAPQPADPAPLPFPIRLTALAFAHLPPPTLRELLLIKDPNRANLVHRCVRHNHLSELRLLAELLEANLQPRHPTEGYLVRDPLAGLSEVDASEAVGARLGTQVELGSLWGAEDGQGKSPLMLAFETNRDQLVSWLLRMGANPEQRSSRGENVLHAACRCGAVGCLRVLFDQGRPGYSAQQVLSAISAEDAQGETPLHLAARLGDATIFLMYINQGAPLMHRNPAGQGPLDVASEPVRAAFLAHCSALNTDMAKAHPACDVSILHPSTILPPAGVFRSGIRRVMYPPSIPLRTALTSPPPCRRVQIRRVMGAAALPALPATSPRPGVGAAEPLAERVTQLVQQYQAQLLEYKRLKAEFSDEATRRAHVERANEKFKEGEQQAIQKQTLEQAMALRPEFPENPAYPVNRDVLLALGVPAVLLDRRVFDPHGLEQYRDVRPLDPQSPVADEMAHLRAVRVEGGTAVLLKRFSLASAAAVQVFTAEALMSIRLSHPNIVPLGRLFVDVPTEGASDPVEIRSMLRGCLEGLLALHAQGFIHGDLQPTNIYVTHDERFFFNDTSSCLPCMSVRLGARPILARVEPIQPPAPALPGKTPPPPGQQQAPTPPRLQWQAMRQFASRQVTEDIARITQVALLSMLDPDPENRPTAARCLCLSYFSQPPRVDPLELSNLAGIAKFVGGELIARYAANRPARQVDIHRESIVKDMVSIYGGVSPCTHTISVRFIGEPGIDAGGLRSEAFDLFFRNLATEPFVFSSKFPGQTLFADNSKGKLVPNPVITPAVVGADARSIRAPYVAVGRILLGGLLQGVRCSLPFVASVWKVIQGVPLEEHLDFNLCWPDIGRHVAALANCPPGQVEDYGFDFGMAGGSPDQAVTAENRQGPRPLRLPVTALILFVEAIRRHYLNTLRDRCTAMRDGIFEIPDLSFASLLGSVPGAALRLVFTPPTHVTATMIEPQLRFEGLGAAFQRSFIDMLRGWEHEDADPSRPPATPDGLKLLNAFVRFVTGSTVLQPGREIKLKRSNAAVDRLPLAHTCFWAIDTPEYPSPAALDNKFRNAVLGSQGFGFA